MKKSKSRKGNHNEDPKSGKESNVNFDSEATKTSFKPTAKMQVRLTEVTVPSYEQSVFCYTIISIII